MTIKESNKRYYEQIIAHLTEKRMCEVCMREYPLYELSRHRKTNKHIKFLDKHLKSLIYILLEET